MAEAALAYADQDYIEPVAGQDELSPQLNDYVRALAQLAPQIHEGMIGKGDVPQWLTSQLPALSGFPQAAKELTLLFEQALADMPHVEANRPFMIRLAVGNVLPRPLPPAEPNQSMLIMRLDVSGHAKHVVLSPRHDDVTVFEGQAEQSDASSEARQGILIIGQPSLPVLQMDNALGLPAEGSVGLYRDDERTHDVDSEHNLSPALASAPRHDLSSNARMQFMTRNVRPELHYLLPWLYPDQPFGVAASLHPHRIPGIPGETDDLIVETPDIDGPSPGEAPYEAFPRGSLALETGAALALTAAGGDAAAVRNAETQLSGTPAQARTQARARQTSAPVTVRTVQPQTRTGATRARQTPDQDVREAALRRDETAAARAIESPAGMRRGAEPDPQTTARPRDVKDLADTMVAVEATVTNAVYVSPRRPAPIPPAGTPEGSREEARTDAVRTTPTAVTARPSQETAAPPRQASPPNRAAQEAAAEPAPRRQPTAPGETVAAPTSAAPRPLSQTPPPRDIPTAKTQRVAEARPSRLSGASIETEGASFAGPATMAVAAGNTGGLPSGTEGTGIAPAAVGLAPNGSDVGLAAASATPTHGLEDEAMLHAAANSGHEPTPADNTVLQNELRDAKRSEARQFAANLTENEPKPRPSHLLDLTLEE